MSAKHVVIVGQGIFGVTAALELARRGYNVTTLSPTAGLDPDPCGASTDISKLVRLDYGADELYMELMELSLAGWKEWNRKWGEEVYHETGVLALNSTPMEKGSFSFESLQLLKKRGHLTDDIDSQVLRERFPAWNTQHYRYGYFNRESGWVESTKATRHLIKEAVEVAKIRMVASRMQRLLIEGERNVVGVETITGEKIMADYVIVAAGGWTPILLPHLQGQLSTTGHIVFHFQPSPSLVPQFSPPSFPPYFADIETTGYYGFPAHPNEGGRVKVGNHGQGYKLEDYSAEGIKSKLAEIKDKEEVRFRQFIETSFPALSSATTVMARLCLYCDTLDGDFLIGHDPHFKGLFVASGDSGHGFKFGPEFGRIIADGLEGKENKFAARFAFREMNATKREKSRCIDTEGPALPDAPFTRASL